MGEKKAVVNLDQAHFYIRCVRISKLLCNDQIFIPASYDEMKSATPGGTSVYLSTIFRTNPTFSRLVINNHCKAIISARIKPNRPLVHERVKIKRD